MAEESHYINGAARAAEWRKFSRFSGKKSKKLATPLALPRERLPFGGVILGSNPSGVANVCSGGYTEANRLFWNPHVSNSRDRFMHIWPRGSANNSTIL
jgi:hypothetical protein